MKQRMMIVGLVLCLLAAACTSSDGASKADACDGAEDCVPILEAEEAGTGSCDPVDGSACLLPWPNDRFTRVDPATGTGRRLDLPRDGMPRNAEGTPIDPAEWNRNDGFAPASHLLVHIPGLDVEASELPPVTDLERSLDEGSPLVLVDLDAEGEGDGRVAAWAELDANATDPERQALIIVPAHALAEGHRYAVGLRDLVAADGSDIEPSEAFADQLADPDDLTTRTVEALEGQGIEADDLDVAWTFTVGSADDLSGRLRHMWSETLDEVGEGAPPFEVTATSESGAATIVEGTFAMPKYLTGDGGPGEVLDNGDDPDGIPTADGTMDAAFFCTVPTAATADDPAPSIIYGHGLLGTRQQTLDLGLVGASANQAFCGLDWIGMSAEDVPAIVESFADLTGFRTVPDRLQQGHLGFLLLGRLLRSDEGFATDPAFQDDDGRPILDTGQTAFLGASQGGILGGVPSALTNDWTQTILAVPGMGYNLLLRRSIDFDEFYPVVEENYPDELDQTLVLDLLEQLWQRGENAGYAQHLTDDPYPGVEEKDVLLLEAFGDHQVANVSTEKLARTLGVPRYAPTLRDGRSSDVEPLWGIDAIESLPASGSALYVWDFGTPTPPTENLPNRQGDDPHGDLAGVPEALALVLSFVNDRQLIDVCGGEPCVAPG